MGYTRRQTPSHKKANVFALYLASDLYCTYTCMYMLYLQEQSEDEKEDSLQGHVDEVPANAWTVCGQWVIHIANILTLITEPGENEYANQCSAQNQRSSA